MMVRNEKPTKVTIQTKEEMLKLSTGISSKAKVARAIINSKDHVSYWDIAKFLDIELDSVVCAIRDLRGKCYVILDVKRVDGVNYYKIKKVMRKIQTWPNSRVIQSRKVAEKNRKAKRMRSLNLSTRIKSDDMSLIDSVFC